jgi:hypothetical protein
LSELANNSVKIGGLRHEEKKNDLLEDPRPPNLCIVQPTASRRISKPKRKQLSQDRWTASLGPNYATFYESSNVKSKSNVHQMRVDYSGGDNFSASWNNSDSLGLSKNGKNILNITF